jgi:hypothetical protein
MQVLATLAHFKGKLWMVGKPPKARRKPNFLPNLKVSCKTLISRQNVGFPAKTLDFPPNPFPAGNIFPPKLDDLLIPQGGSC